MNKLIAWFKLCCWSLAVSGAVLNAPVRSSATTIDQPAIVSVTLDDTNVVVLAEVPKGIAKVTLESRTRMAVGSWVPNQVARLDGTGGTVTFRVPMSAQLEVLRVRADAQDALPSYFYKGTNSYNGALSTTGNGVTTDIRTFENAGAGAPTVDTSKSSATRDVKESDIWQIDGDTLYFFNQLRGLQVIDIAKPEAPVLRGTLDLPAVGEQMYVLGDGVVVLLARNSDYYYGSQNAESAVLLVKTVNGVPGIVARLSVAGYIQESRMVGTALYVAAQTSRPMTAKNDGSWEWGTMVSSFDLSNPEKPAAKDTLWYSGYGNVVTATDRFLFVATTDTSNWRNSLIRYMDISSPDGAMRALGTITPRGQVPDKFKMHMSGDVFTVISQNWNETRRWQTTLETFSLADPTAPKSLGLLDFVKAQGETLHATRFDGDRVYVVTYFQKDPLWVVDLTDPANPAIKGELEVPGWSTYIEPLGDRLVTVGIDNSNSWRVAVSLFDVKDPAKPALVSKVPLGENYSWSEATYDEKAFNVMPEAGLILVPYQGYFTNGYASRVQLIDLDLADTTAGALRARGTIKHQFTPRRATVFKTSILSISGQELLSVDAKDRDNPTVQASLELAWSVNRVFVQGDYLIEVTDGARYGNNALVTLRVTPSKDISTTLARFDLTNGLAVAGAVVRNGYLFLAQTGDPIYVTWIKDANSEPPLPEPPFLMVSAFDLSKLPALSLAGQTKTTLKDVASYSLQAVWPKDGLLVWSGGYNYYYGPMYAFDTMRLVGGAMYMPWRYYGGGSGRFIAFDVSNPAEPKFVSDYSVPSTNNWWNFSSAIAQDGMIYTSHQGSEFLPGVKPPYPPTPTIVYDKETGIYTTNEPPFGAWVQRYYLDVVDYADPANPTSRKPVNIPGTLQGISRQGALLFTLGQHWAADGISDYSDWLDACAYDGVSASLIDSLPMPKDWPHPLLAIGDNLLVGRPASTTNTLNRIESWVLSDAGRFTPTGAVFQASAASTLRNFGSLLAAQNNDGTFQLYDATDATQLKGLNWGRPAGYIWGDLSRADGDLQHGLWFPLDDYGVWILSSQKSE